MYINKESVEPTPLLYFDLKPWCNISGSHSGVPEDSVLIRCYAVSCGIYRHFEASQYFIFKTQKSKNNNRQTLKMKGEKNVKIYSLKERGAHYRLLEYSANNSTSPWIILGLGYYVYRTVHHLDSWIKIDQLMSLVLLFHYLLLNMIRMLVHPSSGACDLFVELFHVLYCSG